MFRLWLIILALFSKHISRDVYIMASVSRETCAAPNEVCSGRNFPKLVRLNGVQEIITWNKVEKLHLADLLSELGFISERFKHMACSPSTNSATLKSSGSELLVEKPEVKSSKVGHVQSIKLTDSRSHQLITKSLRPLVFEIPDFLSAQECEHIINLASKAGLSESTTLPDSEDEIAVTDEEMKEDCRHLLGSDGNSNGKVSALELGMFINQTFGIALNDADVNMMLKRINFDKDGDGEISLNECMAGDHLVFDQYMKNLEDNHPLHRTRLSQQTWLRLGGSTDAVLRGLQERIIQLTNLPRVFIERSEDLQVVRYGVHGHYHAHYDSTAENDASFPCCSNGNYTGKCSLCRFMTVLYYLNDVPRGGETAFPVADGEFFNQTEYGEKDMSNLSTHCHDANLVVRPTRGKAIMWYNHVINNVTGLLGAQDERSLHGGCDVLEGHKWIANNWINAPFEW